MKHPLDRDEKRIRTVQHSCEKQEMLSIFHHCTQVDDIYDCPAVSDVSVLLVPSYSYSLQLVRWIPHQWYLARGLLYSLCLVSKYVVEGNS